MIDSKNGLLEDLPAQVVARIKGALADQVVIPYYILEPPGGA